MNRVWPLASHKHDAGHGLQSPVLSQPEGSGTFQMGTWNIVDGRGDD